MPSRLQGVLTTVWGLGLRVYLGLGIRVKVCVCVSIYIYMCVCYIRCCIAFYAVTKILEPLFYSGLGITLRLALDAGFAVQGVVSLLCIVGQLWYRECSRL